MGHSYGLPTIKALFAEATHCAYPDCAEPLLFEDASRGVRTIAVQIAHIRSPKPGGPRYDPDYPCELLNTEENLLLLCGKHHTPVDQNDSVFTTDELLDWKAAQVAQVGGTVVSDVDLANLVRTLESTLSALYEALRVDVAVDAVGGRIVPGGILPMPLEGLAHVILPDDADPTMLLGVKVVNKGSTGIDVASAGIEFDVGYPEELYLPWIFGGRWCTHGYPHRLEGRLTAYWHVDEAMIIGNVTQLARTAGRSPLRFRPFAYLGDDTREEGEWRSGLQLPIWKEGMTDDQLDQLARWAQRRTGVNSQPEKFHHA